MRDKDNLKCCSAGEYCRHPDGPYLPATLDYFYAQRGAKDGLRGLCIPCCKEYTKLSQARGYKRQQEKLASVFKMRDWNRCLDYFKHRCAYCGRCADDCVVISIDHFISKDSGGDATPDNIVPACSGAGGCNEKKGPRDPLTWIQKTFGAERAEVIIAQIYDYFDYVGNNPLTPLRGTATQRSSGRKPTAR